MEVMAQTEFRTIVRGKELRCAAIAAEAALRKVIDEDQLVQGVQRHDSYVVERIYRNRDGEWIAKVVATKKVA